MESIRKYIFLMRGMDSEDYSTFEQRVKKSAENWINDLRVSTVKICLTLEKPPQISIIPFKKKKAAIISVYYEAEIDLKSASGYDEIYWVEEALPVSYKKDWADHELTPGICLLTLFKKKRSINYETFISRWHNGHTPLSLRIHPLWHYSRNVVKQKMLESSENFDGIVDEHFKKRDQLLNPFLFFGNPVVIIPRMIKVYRDVKSFLDYESIESYLCREIYLKS